MATNTLGDSTAVTSSNGPDATRSYYLTRWPIVNNTLATVDRVTKGKAGVVQRFTTYFFAGGFAAVVNLALFALFLNTLYTSYNHADWLQSYLHRAAAWIPATEISIIANFIPNDFLTFRHMPGHNRHLSVRLARFHLTCLSGTILTAIIYAGLSRFIPDLLAQAAAIAVVFLYNFTVHTFFTYGGKKENLAHSAD